MHDTCPDIKSWPVGHSLPETTSSTESLNWVKAKLDECMSSHLACSSNPTTTLPSRILGVGGSSEGSVRLQETDGEPGRYLCLSHRWGTQAFLCTTTSNFATHKDGISLDDLPITFREAVDFTRKLGLRYIWIDSLCIVQDDVEDWRVQSSKMADIYANAYLTISAAHADGPRAGLFSALKPDMRAHRLSGPSLTMNDGRKPGIYARRAISHVDMQYIGSLAASSPSTKDLPLLQRAWSFQERFLSQRVLYFTSSELAWECSGKTACQCRGEQNAPFSTLNIGSKVLNQRKCYYTSSLAAAFDSKGKEEVARRWLSLVADYSRLEMTFERDIFPALSGLAKVFGAFLDTRYVSGLWKDFLLPGLLWRPVDGGRKQWGSRPLQWRAPSWSWGSANVAISFASVPDLLHACEIASIDCHLRGPDPTGEVTAGEIVARGLISSATVKYRTVGGGHQSWNLFVLDFMEGTMILGNSHADYNWTLDGPGKVEDGAAVRCFLVGVHADQGNCYLVVLKDAADKSGNGKSVFERIGIVEIFGRKVRKVLPDGAVRMVSPYEVVKERSDEETITLI